MSAPLSSEALPPTPSKGSFAVFCSCLLGSIVLVALIAGLAHLVASGGLDSVVGFFTTYGWETFPVLMTLVAATLFTLLKRSENQGKGIPSPPFFPCLVSYLPAAAAPVLTGTVLAYSLNAGWWSPILIGLLNLFNAHLEACLVPAAVIVLTGFCWGAKTRMFEVVIVAAGFALIVLLLTLYSLSPPIDPMETLVREGTRAWNEVPPNRRTTPKDHLDAARIELALSGSHLLQVGDLDSTDHGFTITRHPDYSSCRQRMRDAARDAALYRVVSVNGAPVVAGQNPCTALSQNTFVVEPVTK